MDSGLPDGVYFGVAVFYPGIDQYDSRPIVVGEKSLFICRERIGVGFILDKKFVLAILTGGTSTNASPSENLKLWNGQYKNDLNLVKSKSYEIRFEDMKSVSLRKPKYGEAAVEIVCAKDGKEIIPRISVKSKTSFDDEETNRLYDFMKKAITLSAASGLPVFNE